MTPSTAPTPVYNSRFATGGDIILRASDNILFSVHKANLSTLSAFFRDMFHVGSAELSPESEPITMSERAAVIELLLQTCYPADDGTPPLDFATVEDEILLDLYEAAVKYQMWLAGLALRSFVEPIIGRNPFLVVNLAHRLNDSVMLKRAVAATLEVDILSDAMTFRAKTGILWPNVLEYHFRIRRELMQHFTKAPQISHCCGCTNCANDEKKLVSGELEKALVSGSPETIVAALKFRRDNFGQVRCSNFNTTLTQMRNNNSWPAPFVPSREFSALIP